MTKLIFFALTITFISCSKKDRVLPYYNSPDFEPRWDIAADDSFHRIRPFSLLDQENNSFTEKNIDGKICVVDFFFTTCPGICPKMTESMSVLQTEFISDNNVLLLSHSVTPDKDNVAVLKKYAADKNVDFKKWKLLTGSRSEIYDLGRKFYFVEEDEGVNREESVFLHTENFILIDEQRRIRGIYNGLIPSSIQDLIRDIKDLERE